MGKLSTALDMVWLLTIHSIEGKTMNSLLEVVEENFASLRSEMSIVKRNRDGQRLGTTDVTEAMSEDNCLKRED